MLTDSIHSDESQAGPKIVWDAIVLPLPFLPPLSFLPSPFLPFSHSFPSLSLRSRHPSPNCG